jgi:hypothetical protein
MKTNLVTLLIILSLGIEACSSSYVLTTVPQQTPYFTTQYLSFDELMAKGHGETFTIVMTDGNRVRGTLVQADSANIAWTDVTTRSIHKVPTFLVQHLELSRNYVWEGGTVGLLLCTVPPLATGSWGPGYPSKLTEPDYSGRYFTVIAGVFGGLVGAGVGNAIRTTDMFQVVPFAVQSKSKSDSIK